MRACGLLAEAFFSLLALCLAAACSSTCISQGEETRFVKLLLLAACLMHVLGKTEKVRVAEVSDSQQRIDFFPFFSSRTRRDFLKGLGWGIFFFLSN
jgi:hypothetical protein